MDLFGDEEDRLLNEMLEEAVDAVTHHGGGNAGERGGSEEGVEDGYQDVEQLMHGRKRKRRHDDDPQDEYVGGGLAELSVGGEAQQQQRQLGDIEVNPGVESGLRKTEEDREDERGLKRQRLIDSEQEVGHKWQRMSQSHEQIHQERPGEGATFQAGPGGEFSWAPSSVHAMPVPSSLATATAVAPAFEGSVPGVILQAVDAAVDAQTGPFVFGSSQQIDTQGEPAQAASQQAQSLGIVNVETARISLEHAQAAGKASEGSPTPLDLNVEATTGPEFNSALQASRPVGSPSISESQEAVAITTAIANLGPAAISAATSATPAQVVATSPPASSVLEVASEPANIMAKTGDEVREHPTPISQGTPTDRSSDAPHSSAEVLLKPSLPQPMPDYPSGDPAIIALQLAQIEAHIFTYGRIIRGEKVEPELYALTFADVPKATSGREYDTWTWLESTWKSVLEKKEAAALKAARAAASPTTPAPPQSQASSASQVPSVFHNQVTHIPARVPKQSKGTPDQPTGQVGTLRQAGKGNGMVTAAGLSRSTGKISAARAGRPDAQFLTPPWRQGNGASGLAAAGSLQPFNGGASSRLGAGEAGVVSGGQSRIARVQPLGRATEARYQLLDEGMTMGSGVRGKGTGRPRGRPRKVPREGQSTPISGLSVMPPASSVTQTPPNPSAPGPQPSAFHSQASASAPPALAGVTMGPLMLGHMLLGTPGSTTIQDLTTNFLSMAATNPKDAREAAQAAVNAAAASVATSSQAAAVIGNIAAEALAQQQQNQGRAHKGKGRQERLDSLNWGDLASKAAFEAQAGAAAAAAVALKAQEEMAKIGQQLWQRQISVHGEAGAAAAEALAACHVVQACAAAAEAAAAVAGQARDRALAGEGGKDKENQVAAGGTKSAARKDSTKETPAAQEVAGTKYVLALPAEGGRETPEMRESPAQVKTGVPAAAQASTEAKKAGAVNLKAAARSGGRLGMSPPQASPSQATPSGNSQPIQVTQPFPQPQQFQGQPMQMQVSQQQEQPQQIPPFWLQQQQQAAFLNQFPTPMQAPALQSGTPGLAFPMGGPMQPWNYMSPQYNALWGGPFSAPATFSTPAPPSGSARMPPATVATAATLAPEAAPSSSNPVPKRQKRGAYAPKTHQNEIIDVEDEGTRETTRKKSDKRMADKHADVAPVIGLKHKFLVGSSVECSSTESGLRGGWFTATILQISKGRALVKYDELLADDGKTQLEEWVSLKPVSPAEVREGGEQVERLIRPVPKSEDEEGRRKRRAASGARTWSVGEHVDAWIDDGWWEGVIRHIDEEGGNKATVFFPGEGDTHTVKPWNLRPSPILIGDHWVPWGTDPAARIIAAEDVVPKDGGASIKRHRPEARHSPASRRLTSGKMKATTRRPQRTDTPPSGQVREMLQSRPVNWVLALPVSPLKSLTDLHPETAAEVPTSCVFDSSDMLEIFSPASEAARRPKMPIVRARPERALNPEALSLKASGTAGGDEGSASQDQPPGVASVELEPRVDGGPGLCQSLELAVERVSDRQEGVGGQAEKSSLEESEQKDDGDGLTHSPLVEEVGLKDDEGSLVQSQLLVGRREREAEQKDERGGPLQKQPVSATGEAGTEPESHEENGLVSKQSMGVIEEERLQQDDEACLPIQDQSLVATGGIRSEQRDGEGGCIQNQSGTVTREGELEQKDKGVGGSHSLSALRAELRSAKKQEGKGKAIAEQIEGIATSRKKQTASAGQVAAEEEEDGTAGRLSGRAKRQAAVRARFGRRAGQESEEEEEEEDKNDDDEDNEVVEAGAVEGDEEESDDQDEEEEGDMTIAPKRKPGRPPGRKASGSSRKPRGGLQGAQPSAVQEESQITTKRGTAGDGTENRKGNQGGKGAMAKLSTVEKKKLSNQEKEWKRLGISFPPASP